MAVVEPGHTAPDGGHVEAPGEVKVEKGGNLTCEAGGSRVIEVSSDSSSESSESATCSDTSGVGDSIDLEDDDLPALPTDAGADDGRVTTLARNLKTKIIHQCRSDTYVSINEQSSFDEVMNGTLTSCARVITSSYKLVFGPYDWTAKCRVCFKGRRAP